MHRQCFDAPQAEEKKKFSGMTLFGFVITYVKFGLKLMVAKCLLPMISRNELSITLSVLCSMTIRTFY